MHNYDSCQNSKVPDHHTFSRLLIGQSLAIQASHWLTKPLIGWWPSRSWSSSLKHPSFHASWTEKLTSKAGLKCHQLNINKAFDLREMDERELLREGPKIFVLKEPWLAILPEVQNPATNVIITIIFRHFILKDSWCPVLQSHIWPRVRS